MSSSISANITTSPPDHDPASLIVDLENQTGSARLVVWEDAQAQLNAGDLATKEILIDQYVASIQLHGIDAALETLVESL